MLPRSQDLPREFTKSLSRFEDANRELGNPYEVEIMFRRALVFLFSDVGLLASGVPQAAVESLQPCRLRRMHDLLARRPTFL
jgi:hypothetical protein